MQAHLGGGVVVGGGVGIGAGLAVCTTTYMDESDDKHIYIQCMHACIHTYITRWWVVCIHTIQCIHTYDTYLVDGLYAYIELMFGGAIPAPETACGKWVGNICHEYMYAIQTKHTKHAILQTYTTMGTTDIRWAKIHVLMLKIIATVITNKSMTQFQSTP